MRRTGLLFLLSFSLFILCCACGNTQPQSGNSLSALSREHTRIVSLNGTVTEILCALGLEQYIVAADVTSTYPPSVQQLPKVGHNRSMSAERILAERPTLVIGLKEQIKPELAEQLRGAGVQLMACDFGYSIESGKKLIAQLADTFGVPEQGAALSSGIDTDLATVVLPAASPRVLFIYARGAGTLMVAGKHTAPNTMVQLSGGQNAVEDFEDFKPLTAEALVKANPDVILMFDDGLQSLGGMDGLLQVQGVKETNAGKNRQVIEMDGLYLTGFGPRTGKAVATLSKKLNEVVIR